MGDEGNACAASGTLPHYRVVNNHVCNSAHCGVVLLVLLLVARC